MYNKERNLCNVRDHTGREVNLRYSYRVLSQYINPSGQAYTYGYNENLRLETVTTPRGIEGIRNVYDGANRVVSQKMPDGSVAELRYDDEGQCTYAKVGPTLCTNGDLGIRFTYSPGITLWSNTCSAAYMRYLTITNAPSAPSGQKLES